MSSDVICLSDSDHELILPSIKDIREGKTELGAKGVAKYVSDEEPSRKKKKEELERDKNRKAVEKLNRKNVEPGACLKSIHVHVDEVLKDAEINLDNILVTLSNSDISYKIHHQEIPNSITWTRHIEEYYINEYNEIRTKTTEQKEKQILIIWSFDMVVDRVRKGTFVSDISTLVSALPDRQKTLILYRMERYFFNRSAPSKRPKRDVPSITRDDLEKCLTEIQLVLDCNTRLIESPEDLAVLVHQFTKAIAKIPFKTDQMERVENKIDWYAQGDNRNTVKVDKHGNGLKRLWLQILCQFPLASLETAHAIISVYPSPIKLMQAYIDCTPAEGELLLKDIPIRRAAGPLTAVRKIGPELSKKIFLMFTSEDGETTLSNNDRKL